MGRVDNQLKIRGHRVEIEEVERKLELMNDINEAVVIWKKVNDFDNFLIAFIVSDDEEIDETKIKEELGLDLPEYMIPTLFIKVEDIPLTISGKVDKKVFEKYEIIMEEKESLKTDDVVHKKVKEIVSEYSAIDIGKIDFLDRLGVNSIEYIEIVVAIESEFDIEFDDNYLGNKTFNNIDELSNYVKSLIEK